MSSPRPVIRIEDPKLFPRLRVQGDGLACRGREVESILYHQGSAFECCDPIAWICRQRIGPCSPELADICPIDLLQRRESHPARIVPIRLPFIARMC